MQKNTVRKMPGKSETLSPDTLSSDFVGELSSRRQHSVTRFMSALYARGGERAIPLHSGVPNPRLFPFREAGFTLAEGRTISIEVCCTVFFFAFFSPTNWRISVLLSAREKENTFSVRNLA